MTKNYSGKTKGLVEVALFSAIVFILAFTPFIGYIPLGITKATTVHIPVIIASIMLGPKKGAFIGFVFGLTSLINNTFVAPTITSFVFSPFYNGGFAEGNFWSIVICFLPRILVGVVPFFVYKGFKKIFNSNDLISLGAAGVCGSLTNTLLVMSMIYIFFGSEYAGAKEIPLETLFGVIMGIVGINGIPEAIAAAIISAVICRVLISYNKHKLA